MKRGISGVVGNEESHVFVSDLHWGGSIHTSHFGLFKIKQLENLKGKWEKLSPVTTENLANTIQRKEVGRIKRIKKIGRQPKN